MRLHVDGETFEVRAHPDTPGTYLYDWVSGPNPGYGFGTSTSDNSDLSLADHEEGIRDFLSQVDPHTGFIE
ncbi:hypothetical protein [Solicola sp. PLA-1-18]|uniref:hypothetical protein n=1 Tax=Solicola sp. PLA-1-18 TaxID=3380532 RepID=UPI003B7C426C